jgi:excinuclease UvrABC ATPase subunit
VGTNTKILISLRLLFYARGADAHSYNTGNGMSGQGLLYKILATSASISHLAPVIAEQKELGGYFQQIAKLRVAKVRVNGGLADITSA